MKLKRFYKANIFKKTKNKKKIEILYRWGKIKKEK